MQSKPEEKINLAGKHAVDANNILSILQNPQQEYNSVFSFSVNSNDEYGWITAYSPSHQLVLWLCVATEKIIHGSISGSILKMEL
jgi:hypothetical protein